MPPQIISGGICFFDPTVVILQSFFLHTGVAQLVEQWSPKPKVASSILATRAKNE